jgi:hypothetical protein
MKHTPGPWRVEKSGKRLQIWGDVERFGCPWQEAIAKTNVTSDPFTEHANARLIAAAPELLEALERIIRNGTSVTNTQFDIDAAKAAIHKARGE